METTGLYAFVFLCLSAAGICRAQEEHDHRVEVQVYYESLCEDSIAFVTKQLHPALEKAPIAGRVNLTLVPYGKSSYDAGTQAFTCDHGPKECDGNKIHACALKKIQGGTNTDKLGFNSGALDFINCLMKNVKPKGDSTEFPLKECTEAQASGRVNMAAIQNCAAAKEGSDFLLIQGKLTDAFQKPLVSVPTVVFNRTFNGEDSNLAQKDFVKALCKYIDHDKPLECAASSPAAFFGTIALSLFLLSKVF